MDLLKEIGAILGFVAFGGLAVLVFMTFQQARHLRRLREWAGRAPERAAAEEERAAVGAGEATMPAIGADAAGNGARDGLRRARADGADAWRGRLPLRGARQAAPRSARWSSGSASWRSVVAAVILTGGFGLFGGSDESGAGSSTATQPAEPAASRRWRS